MSNEENNNQFVFDRKKYILLIAGFLTVIIGFIFMSGGGSNDPDFFNPEVFSFRRITLAPFIVISGFGVVAWAIMCKPADK